MLPICYMRDVLRGAGFPPSGAISDVRRHGSNRPSHFDPKSIQIRFFVSPRRFGGCHLAYTQYTTDCSLPWWCALLRAASGVAYPTTAGDLRASHSSSHSLSLGVFRESQFRSAGGNTCFHRQLRAGSVYTPGDTPGNPQTTSHRLPSADAGGGHAT